MKLDMGQAWNSATAMLSANRNVLSIMGGVFFFLPALATAMFMPADAMPQPEPGADPEVLLQALEAFYAEYWYVFLITFIVSAVGMIAIFTLLTDRTRPTVGEAITRGVTGLLPYIAAQFLMVLGIALVVGLIVAIGAVTGVGAVIALTFIAGAIIVVYLAIKFSLTAAVLAIEGEKNPFNMLRRSWQLTKGNSLRIFAFYFLLALAIGVLAAIVSMIFGVVLAALGGEVELLGNAIVGGIVNAVAALVFYAVIAAVHRQLSGGSKEALSDTFE